MKVAIVILNYNGIADTKECLETLQKLVHHDFEVEIIVVDNASKDDSVSEIKKNYLHVTLLINPENLGFAEGNNVGIQYALKRNADFVFLLNNDTLVDSQLVEKLVACTLAHKIGGVFSPKIYFAPGFETHKERYTSHDLGKVIWYAGGIIDWKNMLASHRGVDQVDHEQYSEITKTTFATGCALFVRREVFEVVGLLDTKFYLYYEDLDFCLKARKKGYDIYYVPTGILWHKNAGTSGGSGSDIQSYYITRNRLLIGMRYAPWKTKLALFREAATVLMHGTPTQKQAVGDFLRKKYGRRESAQFIRLKAPNFWRYFRRHKKMT